MTSPAIGLSASGFAVRTPWATASISGTPETLPLELRVLAAHILRCNGLRGRLFALHCTAESVLAFLAPRLVTTIVVTALAFGTGFLVL